ncbi:MAG: hypothetical protein UT66_C0017G0006 [candidate division CPR2 bacterium GW2011_GWC1_39_9]|uniref:Cupin type-2 domain-containing protein n=1 Tax=candidate division CPR2 bacterium GW2011_GWC2_39_10 TaxID=1618345 RepID=A0A0G0LRB0_UNCC2|nr:MAG: hypothetical protein UT18_C0010G0015 [candidate division CPR2 bacterium GW2011_GWC2_39_10]KKR34727.1 MAG: hypothetical protein UT66_C0017G0006 [candidate division CPR2 bacterium GW2011_GWC1_39_9]
MNFETYKINEGKIIIAYSDENISIGYLEVNPGMEFKKHNRPCPETLYQIKGTATMVLFDENDGPKEVVLNEGDEIEIPPKQFHIHANRGSKPAVTMWKAKGNIIDILNAIRESSKK